VPEAETEILVSDAGVDVALAGLPLRDVIDVTLG
jgi:hypothetical protein